MLLSHISQLFKKSSYFLTCTFSYFRMISHTFAYFRILLHTLATFAYFRKLSQTFKYFLPQFWYRFQTVFFYFRPDTRWQKESSVCPTRTRVPPFPSNVEIEIEFRVTNSPTSTSSRSTWRWASSSQSNLESRKVTSSIYDVTNILMILSHHIKLWYFTYSFHIFHQ